MTIPDSVASVGDYAFLFCTGLKDVIFAGNAPDIYSYAFYGTSYNNTITAYYPVGNETWTEDVMQDYGGTITWVAYAPAHTHSYKATVTDPTCTEQGYTTHTCSGCGDTYTDTPTAALGHSYMDTVTPATCTTAGYTTYTCIVCGDTYTDTPTAALGHSFGDWEEVTSATCVDSGSQKRICDVCGYTEISGTDAPGHSWDADYTIDSAATCTQNGSKSIHCCKCDAVKDSEVIPATGHSYMDTVTPATCTTAGCTTHTCSVCGDTCTDTPTEALGHSYNTGVVTTAATCTEKGVKTYTCSICGDSYTEDIPALGHTAVTDEAVAATCTTAGKTAGSHCAVCGEVLVEQTTVAALGHSYEDTVTPATCIHAGYTTHTCSVCGDSYVDTYTDATGSPFVDVQKESRFYYYPVLWAVEAGITDGTNAFTFSPDADCTREQVVTFLWRAAGSPEPTITGEDTGFTDLPKSTSGYYKAILWGYETGIVKGTSSTTFGYKKTVTRAQFVTFLWRFAGQSEPTITGSDTPFEDLPKSTSSYYKAILWAYENGVTTGDGATTFKPNKACTRGQVVTFLYRYCYEGKGKTE